MKSSSQKGAEEKGGKKRMQRTQNMKEKQNLPLKLHPSSLCSSSVVHRPSQDKTRRDPLQTPWISFLWSVLFFLGALLFCVLRCVAFRCVRRASDTQSPGFKDLRQQGKHPSSSVVSRLQLLLRSYRPRLVEETNRRRGPLSCLRMSKVQDGTLCAAP